MDFGGAWDSFLTGASGLISMATGGATPIYGEPEGTTAETRRSVTSQAAATTAVEVVKEPSRVLTRGAEAVLDGATGLSLPLWMWGGAALALLVVLRK